MVKIVMGIGRSGLQEWWLQRLTAMYMLCFGAALQIYLYCYFDGTYETWNSLFSCGIVQVATLFFLISVIMHAWIGIWIVTTDYIKILPIRLIVQIFVNLMFVSEIVWGIKVLF